MIIMHPSYKFQSSYYNEPFIVIIFYLTVVIAVIF